MNDDLKMMQSPGRWPNWPYLPLKRRRPGQMPECGLLMEHGISDPPDLRFAKGANLFHLNELKSEQIEKADPAVLLAEGWVVD